MSSDSLPLSIAIFVALSPVQEDIISLAFETGFYSLCAAFFALSTYLLACKGFNSRTNLTLWLVTVIMFLVSTCHYALSWVTAYSDVLSDLQFLVDEVLDSYPSIPDNPDDSVVFQRVSEVQIYLPIINYILSDAVLLWRAWVLWDRNIKVMIVPALMWFITAVAAFVSVGLLRMGYATISAIIASTLPLVTNIVATSLIAFKAWKYSRSIKAFLGNSSAPKIRAGAVLALLVESGFLYCAIWIAYVISRFSSVGPLFKDIMQAIIVQISGSYPTVVIVLVALQKTAWDMTASIEGVQSVFQVATRPPPAIRFSLSMNDQPNHSPIVQIGFNPPVTTHDDDGCKEIAGAREESGIV
ncbi:hypothetical protein EW146_g8243 [Bondarzewia mesenterica]|uniref:Uncharacterized protein n=1 Tax=Bondarzewia mesenterica TaxID=1095465 RepID=A0A4S4LLF5_9AGAM|nr:hypothetical protein EW146_g8243 [Bondarzewia mesenterica]